MGLKKNIAYSSILTTSLYFFQFITYPYVSRVLGVTNIGICNFAQSVVLFASLFSTFGITTLGIREIAAAKGDRDRLDKTFSGIFQLNLLFTLGVIVLYVIAIETLPQLTPYRKLLYIGIFQILFNTLTMEWLFKGLEDFKYITMRTIVVRIAYVVSVFVFIRDKEDYGLYFIITVGLYVLNGLINSAYSHKLVHYSWQSIRVVLKKYSSPILFLGSQTLLQTLYTSFNVVYLGFVSNDDQVGYYTTATKVQNIILGLYTSFTLVMMPRISAMLAANDMADVKIMIRKSFSILYAFAFPTIILSEVFAPEIISIISGWGYEPAIPLLRIAMPLILVIGLEQILIVQLLMPLRADKKVFTNSLIGGIVGLVFNLLLVGRLQSLGSVLVWTFSEIAVFSSAYYFVWKLTGIMIPLREIIRYIVSFLPLVAICCLISLIESRFYAFLLAIIITVVYTHLVLFRIVRNEIYVAFISRVKSKLSTK